MDWLNESGDIREKIWKDHVRANIKSKESLASYYRRNNLDYKKFLYWKKKFQINNKKGTSNELDLRSLIAVCIESNRVLKRKEELENKKSIPWSKIFAAF
ncbi:MAG: hypothetical protein ABIA04_09740 [Pseudomonadota bacterium]